MTREQAEEMLYDLKEAVVQWERNGRPSDLEEKEQREEAIIKLLTTHPVRCSWCGGYLVKKESGND